MSNHITYFKVTHAIRYSIDFKRVYSSFIKIKSSILKSRKIFNWRKTLFCKQNTFDIHKSFFHFIFCEFYCLSLISCDSLSLCNVNFQIPFIKFDWISHFQFIFRRYVDGREKVCVCVCVCMMRNFHDMAGDINPLIISLFLMSKIDTKIFSWNYLEVFFVIHMHNKWYSSENKLFIHIFYDFENNNNNWNVLVMNMVTFKTTFMQIYQSVQAWYSIVFLEMCNMCVDCRHLFFNQPTRCYYETWFCFSHFSWMKHILLSYDTTFHHFFQFLFIFPTGFSNESNPHTNIKNNTIIRQFS